MLVWLSDSPRPDWHTHRPRFWSPQISSKHDLRAICAALRHNIGENAAAYRCGTRRAATGNWRATVHLARAELIPRVAGRSILAPQKST